MGCVMLSFRNDYLKECLKSGLLISHVAFLLSLSVIASMIPTVAGHGLMAVLQGVLNVFKWQSIQSVCDAELSHGTCKQNVALLAKSCV